MPTVEERIASLEARADVVVDLRTSIGEFRQEMTRAFGQVRQQFEQVHQQFGQVHQRFEQIDKQFEQVDRRFELVDKRIDRLEQQYDRLDERGHRQFTWTVGIQVTVMLAVMAALFQAVVRT